MLQLANVYSRYGDAQKANFFASRHGFGGQYLSYYLRFLDRMDVNIIAGQERYILTMDKYLKNPWDLSAYQGFLKTLAKKLRNRSAGGQKEVCIRFAAEFELKAETMTIKF